MAKRRDELRELLKAFPTPDGVGPVLDGLNAESDRGAALIGSSLLDAALERVLVRALKYNTDDLHNQLFQNRGPLSDFHSKIVIALAFGVINSVVEQELQIVRAIRNVFAHSTTQMSFITPAIARELQRSVTLEVLRKNILKNKGITVEADGKNDFIYLVRLLFLSLDSHHQHLGGLPLQTVPSSKPKS